MNYIREALDNLIRGNARGWRHTFLKSVKMSISIQQRQKCIFICLGWMEIIDLELATSHPIYLAVSSITAFQRKR